MDSRQENIQRSYVLLRIDKEQNESKEPHTISTYQNPVITPPATCIRQDTCKPYCTEAIDTNEVVWKKRPNEKVQDNGNRNLFPKKDFLSLSRGDRRITDNGVYCVNKDSLYNYVTNNGNEIQQEQANKVSNCGTCCPIHGDGQEQQTVDVFFAKASSRDEFSGNPLPSCLKSGITEITSLSNVLFNQQPPCVYHNSERQIGQKDRKVEESFRNTQQEPWNSANSVNNEDLDKNSKLQTAPKVNSTRLFECNKSKFREGNTDSRCYHQTWETNLEIVSLENQPTSTCLKCEVTPKLSSSVSNDTATADHTMNHPSMNQSSSIPVSPDEISKVNFNDELAEGISIKAKSEGAHALSKIEEFKQKEAAFEQTVILHNNLLQQDQNTGSSVEFKTIRGNHPDGYKQQTETTKHLPPNLWSLTSSQYEDGRNKESVSEKGSYSQGSLWSLNQFSRELLPTPPPSSMKKTRSIGSASKKQRVKFDLDVEVHVVPRDSHRLSPVEYNTSDQEVVNDFINNFEEDTEDSFSLISQGSDKEALGEYIPPRDAYDMRSAFVKLSMNGSHTPFRVINKDESPSSGRTFSGIPTGVYPGRRDSLDLIQMQQFLKQQAKERSLFSSCKSATDKVPGQSGCRNNGQKPKQDLIPPSSPSVPVNQYLRKSANTRHFNISSANNNGRISRYAHLQLQRQYDEWENRRKKRKSISVTQPAVRPATTHSPSDSHSIPQSFDLQNQLKNSNSQNTQQPNQFITRPVSKLSRYPLNPVGGNKNSSGIRIQSASAMHSQKDNTSLHPVRGFTPQRVRQSKIPNMLRSGTSVSNGAHTTSHVSKSLPVAITRTYRPKTSDTIGALPTTNNVELEGRTHFKTYRGSESYSNNTEMFSFTKLFNGARSTLKDAHKINISWKSAKKLSEVDSSSFNNKSRVTLARNTRSLREPLPSQNAVTLKTLGLTVHPPRRTGQVSNLSCIQLRKDDRKPSELSCHLVVKSSPDKSLAPRSGHSYSMTNITSKLLSATVGDCNDNAKCHDLAQTSSCVEEHPNNRQSALLLTPRIPA